MHYICTFCNIFVFNQKQGDERAKLKSNTEIKDISYNWKCPVCGKDKSYLNEITEEEFENKKEEYDKFFPIEKEQDEKDLIYYRVKARKTLEGLCAVNNVCDGHPDRLCMGQKYGKPIGFGGAGQGRGFFNNFEALAKYKLKQRIVKEHKEPDMKTVFFDKEIKIPILVSSVSGVKISMNNTMNEADFQKAMIEGAKLFSTIGFSGNTVDEPERPGIEIIKENGGWGVPVFKPQSQDKLLELFKKAELADVIAIGVDLDGCGSTNWALRGKPVFRKSLKELKELVEFTNKPVIFKGIMCLEDAEQVVKSGAHGLVVSNHGGRVLDYGQGVADVLHKISEEFGKDITIMADGAVRTGFDVLKLLALGAQFVLVGRPMARMALAGGSEAVSMYLNYMKSDLRRAMLMTGCDTLQQITDNILIY